jgi:hypothetical protein
VGRNKYARKSPVNSIESRTFRRDRREGDPHAIREFDAIGNGLALAADVAAARWRDGAARQLQ